MLCCVVLWCCVQDVVGVDSAIVGPAVLFQASGHAGQCSCSILQRVCDVKLDSCTVR